MIVLFICNEANQQLVTEREVIKDALNTCLRPESFMRLENLKVPAPAAVQTAFFTLSPPFFQADASHHPLTSIMALRRRADYLRDAFKPAIKRLRDGCDVARRVEESMVTSAALGHAAILEEQANLIQVHNALQFRTTSPKHARNFNPARTQEQFPLTFGLCRRTGCMHTRGLRWSLCIAWLAEAVRSR